jgi:DNA-binding Lrp family transcriptional regulator
MNSYITVVPMADGRWQLWDYGRHHNSVISEMDAALIQELLLRGPQSTFSLASRLNRTPAAIRLAVHKLRRSGFQGIGYRYHEGYYLEEAVPGAHPD